MTVLGKCLWCILYMILSSAPDESFFFPERSHETPLAWSYSKYCLLIVQTSRWQTLWYLDRTCSMHVRMRKCVYNLDSNLCPACHLSLSMYYSRCPTFTDCFLWPLLLKLWMLESWANSVLQWIVATVHAFLNICTAPSLYFTVIK